MIFTNISRKVIKTIKLDDVEMQVIFNSLAVYETICEDFHFVSPSERSCEYVKLAEIISNIRTKLFPLL